MNLGKKILWICVGFLLFASILAFTFMSEIKEITATIVGNKIHLIDGDNYISAEPHTTFSGEWSVLNFTLDYSADVDIGLGFKKNDLIPIEIEVYNPRPAIRTHKKTCNGYLNYTDLMIPNHAYCYRSLAIVDEFNKTVGSYLEFEWNHYFDRIDEEKKTIYWDEEYTEDWQETSLEFSTIDYNYKGMNKWWFVKNIPIIKGKSYAYRFRIEDINPGFNKPKAEFYYTFNPSSKSFPEAVLSKDVDALDPWIASLNTDLLVYWNFSNFTSTDTILMDISSDNTTESMWNGTLQGDPTWVAGKIGGALDLDGVGDYVNISDVTTQTVWDLDGDDFTINAWVYKKDIGSDSIISRMGVSGSNTHQFRWYAVGNTPNTIKFLAYDGTETPVVDVGGSLPLALNTWYMVTVRKEGTNYSVWVNGTIDASVIDASAWYDSSTSITIGKDIYGQINANIDETSIWTRALTRTEIQTLYNDYNAVTYEPPAADVVPAVENNYPENSTTWSTQYVNFTYNVSDADGDTLQNCTLYLQHGFLSAWEENSTDLSITSAINQTFNLTLNLDGENIYWKVGCWESTNHVQGNSSVFNFTSLYPPPIITTIVIDPTSSFTNTSINGTFIVTDADDATVTVYCDWFNDTVLYSAHSDFLSVNTLHNFSLAPAEIQAKEETWNFTCNATDGTYWSAFNSTTVTILNSQPTIDTPTLDPATVYANTSLFNCSTTAYDVDSDSIIINFTWYNSTEPFTSINITTTNNTIESYALTPSLIQNGGETWNCSVQVFDGTNYGDLSSASKTILNTAPSKPTTIIPPIHRKIIVANSQELTCSGSTDIDDDEIKIEFWGDTNDPPTTLLQNTTSTTYNWTGLNPDHYYWRCKAGDNNGGISEWTTQKRFTKADLFANCSAANASMAIALNFSFMDENFTKLQNVSFEAAVKFWGNDTAIKVTKLFEGTILDEILYCISPEITVAVYTDTIISYGKTGYDTRNYFLDENDMISQTQQDIILYLAQSTLTTEISITVTDASDIPLEDIKVEAWMYNIATDTYSLVQSEITNSEGKSKMDLIKYKYFLFRFYEGATLKDSTDKFKLTEDTLTFKITVAEEPLKPTIESKEFPATFTWVNASRNISFSYSGADNVNDLSQVCWIVENITAQNTTNLYSNCFTIAAGSYSGIDSYIIPAQTGYYRAFAYALIKNMQYTLDYYEIDFKSSLEFDDDGVLLGVLIVMGLGGLGLATKNPSVTIMMVVLGVVINSFTYLWIIPWYALISIITVGIILMIIIKS